MPKPKKLCDTAGMDRATWLKVRAHGPDGSIPYAFGGSDVGVIMGVSSFKTAAELWYEKAGLLIPDDDANAGQKMMGHLMEPIVAKLYAERTGNTIIEDTGLYQHPKYPFILANLDYRFIRRSDRKEGVFDSKTTTYRKAMEWANGAIPPAYEMQIRTYMSVMDFMIGDLGALWGNNPDADFATPSLERNEVIEKMILDVVCEFEQSLHDNNPPSLTGVPSDLALKALARIIGKGDKKLPTVELGSKYRHKAVRIAALQEEVADLKEIVKKKEQEAGQLSVQICETMKAHEQGFIDAGKHEILLHYVTRTTKRVDSDRFKKELPEIHKKMLKETHSRKLKVEMVAKKSAAS